MTLLLQTSDAAAVAKAFGTDPKRGTTTFGIPPAGAGSELAARLARQREKADEAERLYEDKHLAAPSYPLSRDPSPFVREKLGFDHLEADGKPGYLPNDELAFTFELPGPSRPQSSDLKYVAGKVSLPGSSDLKYVAGKVSLPGSQAEMNAEGYPLVDAAKACMKLPGIDNSMPRAEDVHGSMVWTPRSPVSARAAEASQGPDFMPSLVGAVPADAVRLAAPEILTAIIDGDLKKLKKLAAKGKLLSGRDCDHNGHSVLWNAIAFQRVEVALWLLENFPSDAPKGNGVLLSEVHDRRQDSLLHLVCYLAEFTAGTAELFRQIFWDSTSPAPRDLVNAQGQTFLHVAASRLNFWYLRYVLMHEPGALDLFQAKGTVGYSPLVFITQALTEGGLMPARPVPQVPPLPEIVLEALSDEMQILAPHLAPFESPPLCCRSEEVLATARHFLCTGELVCSFCEDGLLLWQLLCLCVHYRLPQPLTAYARSALIHSLAELRHDPVLPVLIQASERVGLSPADRGFAACTLLTNGQALDGLHPGEVGRSLLDFALVESEWLLWG